MRIITPPINYDFATFGADKHADIVVSAFTVSHPSGSDFKSARATVGKSRGKFFYEVTISNVGDRVIGIGDAAASLSVAFVNSAQGYGFYSTINDGNFFWKKANNAAFDDYALASGSGTDGSVVSGDVVGVVFNADTGVLGFLVNGVDKGTAYSGIPAGTYFPMVSPLVDATGGLIFNFGAAPFAFTQPSGTSLWTP